MQWAFEVYTCREIYLCVMCCLLHLTAITPVVLSSRRQPLRSSSAASHDGTSGCKELCTCWLQAKSAYDAECHELDALTRNRLDLHSTFTHDLACSLCKSDGMNLLKEVEPLFQDEAVPIAAFQVESCARRRMGGF